MKKEIKLRKKGKKKKYHIGRVGIIKNPLKLYDLFEKEVIDWIMSKEGKRKFYGGELEVNTSKEILEEIKFNVIDAYRRLIRFPERCPSCTRNGRDHDGACETPEWKGKDNGIF